MKDISLDFIIKSNFKHIQKRPALFNQLDHNNPHQWQGWFSQHPLLLRWNCEQCQHEALGRKREGNFFSKPKNFHLPVIAWDLGNDKTGFCLFVSLSCCLTLTQPPPIKTEMYIIASHSHGHHVADNVTAASHVRPSLASWQWEIQLSELNIIV